MNKTDLIKKVAAVALSQVKDDTPQPTATVIKSDNNNGQKGGC